MNGCLQWALLYPSCEAKWKQTSPLALLPGFSTAFLSHYVQPERMKYILFSYTCSIKWQLLQLFTCCNNHVVILPPADIPHNYGKKFLWTNISVDWLCTNILQKHFHDLISPPTSCCTHWWRDGKQLVRCIRPCNSQPENDLEFEKQLAISSCHQTLFISGLAETPLQGTMVLSLSRY